MAFVFSSSPRIGVNSTRFVRVSVSATDQGSPIDPTENAVKFAFLTDPSAHPTDLDWVSGSWETQNDTYFARCLVGPTGGVITLGTGTYQVWIKVPLPPETLVESVGDLFVY